MSSTVNNETKTGVTDNVARLLAEYPRDGGAAWPVEVAQAVHLARVLCQRARELQTPQERRQQAELDRMIQSPHDKATS
jgi:RHH-type transcriptional regulator, proline utilization regulon repressor / proline dehydrogenase / delta 1-pyrroline-5-carboxylate dehydrogenase